ncbi:MAG: galactose mutarotase, partial [Oscillospiraceae bacterium]|nr:galactose mutarotase [Oscillospiraceae bacterium]
MSIAKEVYDVLPGGGNVDVYTLDNGTLRAEVLTYGATLNRLFVPDKNGLRKNVLLTFNTLEQRVAHSAFQGEVVGRYANRIANAKFSLQGKEYHVTANKEGVCLHGGGEFSHALWHAKIVDEDTLALHYTSPAGSEGFPGKITATVRYQIKGGTLAVAYQASADEDTIINLTNHAYFNLAGKGNVLAHVLRINADHYLPTDENSIPTGERRPVAGTAFDFRQ